MTGDDAPPRRTPSAPPRFSYQARYVDGRVVDPYVGYEIFVGDEALSPHSIRNIGRVHVDPTAPLEDAEFYPTACRDGAVLPTGAPTVEPAAAILGRLAESRTYDATLARDTDRVMACRVGESAVIAASELVRIEHGARETTCTWVDDAVPSERLSTVQKSNATSYIVFLVDPWNLHQPVSFVRIVSASYRKKAVYRAIRESFEFSVGSFSHVSHALVTPVESTDVYCWSDEALAPYLPDGDAPPVTADAVTDD